MLKKKAVPGLSQLLCAAILAAVLIMVLPGISGVSALPDDGDGEYGYYSMSEEMIALYDDIENDVETMITIGQDITSPAAKSGEIYYRPISGMTYEGEDYGLSYEQMTSVYSVIRLTHPEYYFMPGIVIRKGNAMELVIIDEFASANAREEMDNLIERTKAELLTDIPDDADIYDKVLAVHDRIIEDIDYAYDQAGAPSAKHWAHSIVGAVSEEHAGTCETFANWFCYLLRDLDIENYIVTGVSRAQNHAWNIVKMDDGKWYDFDLTWDNGSSDPARGIYYGWFASPASEFDSDHTKKPEDSYGLDYLYRVPQAEDSDKYNYYRVNGMIPDCSDRESFSRTYADLFERAEESGKSFLLMYAGDADDYDFILEEFQKTDLLREYLKQDGHSGYAGVTGASIVNYRLFVIYITSSSLCESSPTGKHEFTEQDLSDSYLVSPATCASRAVYCYACKYCGEKSGQTYEYGEFSPVHKLSRTGAKKASCTLEGNIEYWYCSVCRKYFDSAAADRIISYEDTVIGSTGHSFGDYTDVGDAHQRVCAVCSEKETEPHKWDGGTLIAEPTAEEPGIKQYVCKLCKAESFEEIPYTGHIHSYTIRNCDEDGHWLECECGQKSDFAPHYIEEDTSEYVAPTHLTEGKRVYICEECGYRTEETLLKTAEHTFGEWEKRDEYTHSRSCECGYYTVENHNFDSGKVTLEPTRESAGIRIYTCKKCGAERTEVIPKSDHDHIYSDTFRSDENNHWRECSCGDKSDLSEHTFEERIVTPATHFSEGEVHLTCTVCGFEKDGIIPKSDQHLFGQWRSGGDSYHIRYCECGAFETADHKWRAVGSEKGTDSVKVTFECPDCGAHTVKEITVQGHSHIPLESVWGRDGENHYRECAVCSERLESEPHSFEKVSEKDGLSEYVCTVCGEKKTVTEDQPHIHSFGEWKREDSLTHCRECSCGEKETAEHIWQTDSVNTVGNIRTVKSVCTVCGDTKTEQESISAADSKRALKIIGFTAAAVASAGAAIGTVIMIRSGNKKGKKNTKYK